MDKGRGGWSDNMDKDFSIFQAFLKEVFLNEYLVAFGLFLPKTKEEEKYL